MRRNIVSAGAIALAAVAAPAFAGSVYVNSPLVNITAETGSVAQAKYRLSNTNFDMSLDHGAGTNPGQFIQHNLGNNATLNNVSFRFTLEHRAGEGFVFSMQNTVTNAITNLSWGSFAGGAPAGTTATSLNGFAPNRAFNGLLIEARGVLNPSSMAFSNISFASPTLTNADGSFDAGVANPATNDPSPFAQSPFNWAQAGHYRQFLVSTADLSLHDWVFAGTVTGSRTGSGGDENVRFSVGAKNFTFNLTPTIPLPSAAGMGFAALAALAARRRRA